MLPSSGERQKCLPLWSDWLSLMSSPGREKERESEAEGGKEGRKEEGIECEQQLSHGSLSHANKPNCTVSSYWSCILLYMAMKSNYINCITEDWVWRACRKLVWLQAQPRKEWVGYEVVDTVVGRWWMGAEICVPALLRQTPPQAPVGTLPTPPSQIHRLATHAPHHFAPFWIFLLPSRHK